MSALNEWIEHDGKGAPDLAPGTKVVVRLGDGFEDSIPRAWEWWHCETLPDASNWVWPGGVADSAAIVAYCVVQSSAD